MSKLAFSMKLFPGKLEEYKRRHDEIWPELSALLTAHGVSDYSIFLQPESLELFGVLQVSDMSLYKSLPEHPIMKKWWLYMKDLMETNEDNSPKSIELSEVFYLA